MSLSVFKLSQIKTGDNCLVLGHGSSGLAAKIMKKKFDLGIHSGIIYTNDQSDFRFEEPHKLKFKSKFGKRDLKGFLETQLTNPSKRLLIVNSQEFNSKQSNDLVNIMKHPDSNTVVVVANEDPSQVPENIKENVDHVFKLSDGVPTVVESGDHTYQLA